LKESNIIQGCLKNEASAQRALVDSFAGYLFTVARRYMPDEASAQDVLQEGFIKIFKNFHQFRNDQGKLKNWMSRIVANEALRRRKKYMDYYQSSDPETLYIKADPKVWSALHEEEILNLVRELPDQYRMVFNLYVMEGFDHKEIGEKLNINASTSRSNLARAKAILRKRIIQTENNDSWEKINLNIV
jgi:RNA polymerase sigma-70 factor (ECF subfamily)